MASIHADSFNFELDASIRRRAWYATGGFSRSVRNRWTATYSAADAAGAGAGAPAKPGVERAVIQPTTRRMPETRRIL